MGGWEIVARIPQHLEVDSGRCRSTASLLSPECCVHPVSFDDDSRFAHETDGSCVLPVGRSFRVLRSFSSCDTPYDSRTSGRHNGEPSREDSKKARADSTLRRPVGNSVA